MAVGRPLEGMYKAMTGQLEAALDEAGTMNSGAQGETGQVMRESALQPTFQREEAMVSLPKRQTWFVHMAYVSAIAVLTMITWGAFSLQQRSAKPSIGSMLSTHHCTWGPGTLPTVTGSRLAPGRLHLLKGLASIELGNGVKLTLDAPASVTLQSLTHCKVHVTNLLSRESKRLVESQVARIRNAEIWLPGSVSETLGPSLTRVDDPGHDTETRLISTAQGLGKDVFVWRRLIRARRSR
ncbi:MAG: hypothetical protein AAGD07_21420 [Planctomycetota bacterium]